MRIHKFGGTSVGDAHRIGQAADLVLASGPDNVVVVSALAGVTDGLTELVMLHRAAEKARIGDGLDSIQERHLDAARSLLAPGSARDCLETRLREIRARVEAVLTSPPAATGAADPVGYARLTDEVVTAGEDWSAELMAAALGARGAHARVVDARGLIRTDARFGDATPLEADTRRLVAEGLRPLLDKGITPVVQGFTGATVNHVTTTLGRGGSDFTAAILAAALDAEEAHIWTDVSGILSADPGAVEGARLLDELGFEEAVELAHFGAKVLHAKAAKWAASRGVQVRIRNTFDPQGHETRIRWDRRGSPEVAAVAFKPGVILIKVRAHPSSLPYGFLARVFDVLARHRLPVDLVATSHSSTAFTVHENEEMGQVGHELAAFADVEVIPHLATVTVVGHGLMEEPGVNGRVFQAVGSTPVHLISQASDVSLSFLVAEDAAPSVVQRIHDGLIRHRNGYGREGTS